jgi:hypothetical protein
MKPISNGSSSAPDGPPLACITRSGSELHVTVLHVTAADLMWQLRQGLAAVYGCSVLRLTVVGTSIALQWHPPRGPRHRS